MPEEYEQLQSLMQLFAPTFIPWLPSQAFDPQQLRSPTLRLLEKAHALMICESEMLFVEILKSFACNPSIVLLVSSAAESVNFLAARS